MKREVNDRELLSLMLGELHPERAEELERRMAGDRALAGRYADLRRSWEGLEPSPSIPAPPGFAARVVDAAETSAEAAEGKGRDRLVLVRAAAALALAVGLALGALLGSALEESRAVALEVGEETLAESYWAAMEDSGLLGNGADEATTEEVP